MRSYEDSERAFLENLGVRIIYMEEVAERGIESAIAEALSVAVSGTAGFGVSLDLDALDPTDAPGVGSPVADGIRAEKLIAALAGIGHCPGLLGVEIAEYNPALDADGATARIVKNLLRSIYSGVGE